MFFRLILLIAIFFFSQNGISQTVSGMLAVTATVGTVSSCVLGSVTPMIFANYNPLDSHSNIATASLTINCNTGVPYDIGMGVGKGINANVKARKMTKMFYGKRSSLSYGLYPNRNRTRYWGKTTGKDTMHRVGSKRPQTYTIYGEILKNQRIEPGVYTDSVRIFVTF